MSGLIHESYHMKHRSCTQGKISPWKRTLRGAMGEGKRDCRRASDEEVGEEEGEDGERDFGGQIIAAWKKTSKTMPSSQKAANGINFTSLLPFSSLSQ